MTDDTVVDWLTDAVLRADARGEAPGPGAVVLLLRRYVSTGRASLRGAVERGLTRALNDVEAALSGAHEAHRIAADWLIVLAEAASFADDERIRPAMAAAASAIRRGWPSRGDVAPAMKSVGACLVAADAAGGDAARDLIVAAVDELERVLGRVYSPGEPLARSLRTPDEPDGGLAEHVAAADALLVAHAITGRLPYAMLADELMHSSLAMSSDDFAARCEAARVLCRLAMLHDDGEYRQAAVAAAIDYRDAARRVLDALGAGVRDLGAAGAIYGVAVDELAAARTSSKR